MKIDADILKQLQNGIATGDQRSFEDLYRLFFARLFNFSLLFVHKREIAEETVNDVMIKVWSKRADLDHVKNLETYLFVAVRNQSLNYLSQYSHLHIAIEPENERGQIISINDPEKELEWKEINF